MAKVFKITTASLNVVITETYDDEYAAFVGEDPQSADVKITEYKAENIRWKKEKVNE